MAFKKAKDLLFAEDALGLLLNDGKSNLCSTATKKRAFEPFTELIEQLVENKN